jgi:hypothetical protein
MDLVLVSITAVSLVLAIAMGLIVLKLLREERGRSDARAALLAAATASEPGLELELAPPASESRLRVGDGAAIGELFAVPETESPWLRRAGVAAAVAAVVALSGYALSRTGGTAETVAAAHAPLELLALNHAQRDGVLTITGSVRNPEGAAAVTDVVASAFLFGPDGSFLTSGRSPLDYATLAPGDQSQFVISVPVGRPVSRYRVGFRGADGSVVAHVDRRAGSESASNTAAAGETPWPR